MKTQRAMVLILVLWAIVLLCLLGTGVGFTLRQSRMISSIENDRIVAQQLARAGVERCIAEIMDDPRECDSMRDDWYDCGAAMRDRELAGGTFSVMHPHGRDETVAYGAEDESSKLNINSATMEQLLALPEMTASIAAAIIDWRDADENPEPQGVERAYYQGLTHPYEIRNGSFKTVRELLLVRGVTPALLYGEDANLNGLLDPNEDDGAVSEPNDNGDSRLDRGWFAFVTVYSYEKNVNAIGEKRVNIKTADANTLARRLNLESWAAESIVKAREKNAFSHAVDLLQVPRDASTMQSGSNEQDIHVRSDSEKNQPVTETMFRQIVDEITLKDDEILVGRININTAPVEVLKTLPGADAELAEAIVRYRQGDQCFVSVADLLKITGLTREKFGQMEDTVSVRSTVFRICSVGRAASGAATSTVECIVDRNAALPRVAYWLESAR
jgi:DNA uptake protein ComE-like DNA-binding protein